MLKGKPRTCSAAEVVLTGLMDVTLPFFLDADLERMSVGRQRWGRAKLGPRLAWKTSCFWFEKRFMAVFTVV